MKIILKARTVYGKVLVYPYCDESNLLLKLTKKKTFDSADLLTIQRLGYSIDWKAETVEAF